MGDFRITIEGVGNHGCGRGTERQGTRDVGGIPTAIGLEVARCRLMHCVDCRVAEFVERLRREGCCSIHTARLEHWPVPGAAGTTRVDNPGPVDDLVKGTRDRPF